MAEDVLKKIDEQVKQNKIMLYMKGTPDFPMCGFSAATALWPRSRQRRFGPGLLMTRVSNNAACTNGRSANLSP